MHIDYPELKRSNSEFFKCSTKKLLFFNCVTFLSTEQYIFWLTTVPKTIRHIYMYSTPAVNISKLFYHNDTRINTIIRHVFVTLLLSWSENKTRAQEYLHAKHFGILAKGRFISRIRTTVVILRRPIYCFQIARAPPFSYRFSFAIIVVVTCLL